MCSMHMASKHPWGHVLLPWPQALWLSAVEREVTPPDLEQDREQVNKEKQRDPDSGSDERPACHQ